MVMKVLSYKYTPELQNKSSPVYKETERNFTKVMDKVFQNTPGYQRTEVLNFTKGSVKVDFRVIIVVVATDPKNASSIVDTGAETGQKVVRQAKSGNLPGIAVDPVVEVKGPPPEPLNVTVSDKKSNQLSVQWLPPEETIAFGIYGYIVQHWRFATKDVFAKHVKAPEGKSEFSYQIQNLEPDTSYVIRVAAKNNYGKNFNEGTAYQTLPAPIFNWVVALIGIAVAFVIALIIGVTICLRLTRRETREQQYGEREMVPAEMHLYSDDIFRDRTNERGSKFSFVNASFKPTEVNWTEIPYESINLMDEIGSGAFGVVYKGEILRGKNDVTPCAVKALKASATDEEVRDLYNELEIMTNVGKHPNLVNLIGACTGNGKLLVVLEIAENGSLLEFLKRHRSKNEGYEGEGTSPGGALPEDVKLRISLDVARGMAHLSKHRCIHRDLAARNVLLGKNLVAKVADYGMARDVYEQLMYKKETQGKLPVKWMAIESLETYVFTLESDVWSYGVLLWEIESGGVKPYPGLTTTELMSELRKGYRLEKPNGCSDAMYQLMRSCWHPKPKLRPSFDELVERLEMSVSS
ncbi:angiopoietin-1 receptor-like [Acropora millepora]|uniref:angiopoietin-1 receptor-like n=1 Tax=Acropora millepora TaxID=45264 RepID=UPI001CF1C1F9|nr:angiopoietin-1 receptor-like [Acropora millepora]